MTVLFLAALIALGVAALVDLVAGRRLGDQVWLPYFLCAAGMAALAVVGAAGVAGAPATLSLSDWLGFGEAALTTDRLSGLFLLLVGVTGAGASLGAAGWSRKGAVRGRGVAASCILVLGSVAVVVTADNSFLFLLAWEAMTFGFYLVVGAERWRRARAQASLVTFAFGKVSGAALLLGLLIPVAYTHSFALADLDQHMPGLAHAATYALLVLAFAVKVGLVPVQVWMPQGYAAAPGGTRAILAGVAVNAGFYGLWRMVDLLGAPPTWLAVLLLVCAAVTAVLGIAHSAVQTRLERAVAYSSVENAGLICVGFAIALVGASVGNQRLVAVGLLAGLLQTVAHAFAKTLLFVTTGAIELATQTTELDALRGIGRRLPWAGTGLGVGAVTLAGLPPTIGFASEWFLLEALMQQFRVGNLAMALGMAFAGALVALTAGFASVAFVRIVGLTVLGPIRHVPVPTSRLFGLGIPGRVAVVLLGLGCLGIAAVTPLEIRVLAEGLGDIVPASVTLGALKSPWVVQPVYSDFSILSPSWLWVMMPAIFAALLLLAAAASRGRLWRVRRTRPWLSATGGVEGVDQYTPFGYANPTRRVLANLLRTRTQLRPHTTSGGGDLDGAPHAGTPLGYSSDVVEVVEEYVYRPLARPLLALARGAKRFQSGRIDAYLAYMLIALVAVIAVVVVVS